MNEGRLKVTRLLTSTVSSCMALTHWLDSIVHGRTVSVRPSRNRRVMLASYVRQNLPASLTSRNDHLKTAHSSSSSLKRLSTYSVVGQLEGHLDESVWTNATFLDQTLAESRVRQQAQVHIAQQSKRNLFQFQS